MTKQIKQKIPFLQALIHHSDMSQFSRSTGEESQLDKELEEIINDADVSEEILNNFFPQTLPTTADFYTKLYSFFIRISQESQANKAMAAIWISAKEKLTIQEYEELLYCFSLDISHNFFIGLNWLPYLLEKIELNPKFIAKWFPAIFRRIGSDLASSDFWLGLEVFCNNFTHAAIDTITLLHDQNNEPELAIAAFLIGSVRALSMDPSLTANFIQLEKRLITEGNSIKLSIYRRSWVQTARKANISLTDFQKLAEHFYLSTEGEDEAFGIVCNILSMSSLSTECFEFGKKWLYDNSSMHTSRIAKYAISNCIAMIATTNYRDDLLNLLLQIQPISPEDKGTWTRIAHFLLTLQSNDFNKFCSFFLQLAEKSAEIVLKISIEKRIFGSLYSQIQNKEIGVMIGKLCFSLDSNCRRLGLFLFDILSLTSLPSELSKNLANNAIKLAFYELQRMKDLQGSAIAHFLINLIPFLEKEDENFQNTFLEEITLQAKNYGGICLETFKQCDKKFPILQAAIKKADKYFESLRSLKNSSIICLDIPGYYRAKQRYDRKISNYLNTSIKKHSIFLQHAKKIYILYGKSYRTYSHEQISETVNMQQFSELTETPRIYFVDPELMAMRKFYATFQIQNIEKISKENAENDT